LSSLQVRSSRVAVCYFGLFHVQVDATRKREAERQAAREAARERREAEARQRAQEMYEEAQEQAKEEARAWQEEAEAVK